MPQNSPPSLPTPHSSASSTVDLAQRLRQVADEILAAKSMAADPKRPWLNAPGLYSDNIGRRIDELLSMGAFDGPEYAAFRIWALRANRDPDALFLEAISFLAPERKDEPCTWEAFFALAGALKRLADSLQRATDAPEAPQKHMVTSQAASAKMSTHDLATRHGVDAEALRKRLDRWRRGHDAGYSEVSNARRNEPKYLYDESVVMPVIEALKAKPVGRKRSAGGQRKKR